MMDSRERHLIGAKGFDFDWWIFSASFAVRPLKDMQYPKWFAWLMCNLGRHSYWIDGIWFAGSGMKPTYKCLKCGKVNQ
jgi:hypothetical protein